MISHGLYKLYGRMRCVQSYRVVHEALECVLCTRGNTFQLGSHMTQSEMDKKQSYRYESNRGKRVSTCTNDEEIKVSGTRYTVLVTETNRFGQPG